MGLYVSVTRLLTPLLGVTLFRNVPFRTIHKLRNTILRVLRPLPALNNASYAITLIT